MQNLKLDSVQTYFNEANGNPLQLCFSDHELTVDGILVRLRGVPLLKDIETGSIHYPDKTKHLISFFVTEAKKAGHQAVSVNPKVRNVSYSFAKEFKFNYSYIDYEYIPGLARPWDEGFLTPVFFNLAVLNKYSQHPEYKLELVSETYGTIWKGDEWAISFGINKNKKVIMWLGDIDHLPDNEKHYLRSENIESDHDIHSEFYDGQIEAEFTEPSAQTLAFHARQKLSELVNQKYGFDLYMLEGEVSTILENLDIPVFWHEKHISPFIESLNKIFVESLNTKGLKKYFKESKSDTDVKDIKGLKLLQLWFNECLNAKNVSEIMLPFFVLYDFRILSSHLVSKNRKDEILKSINERLNLDYSNIDYQKIYENLIDKVLNSYNLIINIINPVVTNTKR